MIRRRRRWYLPDRWLALVLVVIISCLTLFALLSPLPAASQGNPGRPTVRDAQLRIDFTGAHPSLQTVTRGALGARGLAIAGSAAGEALSVPIPVPLERAEPALDVGILWYLAPASSKIAQIDGVVVTSVRGSADGSVWGVWQTGREFMPAASDVYGQAFATDLFSFDKDTRFVQFKLAWEGSAPGTDGRADERVDDRVTITGARLIFISAGATPPSMQSAIDAVRSSVQADAPSKPGVISRTGWGCPEGQTAPRWPPVYTDVHHLIVHHTATPNGESDWPARVRSIWHYHANTLGWGDIGYNYLIDINGVIYEGRAGGDDARGGHDAINDGSMGVSLIGTFTSAAPSQAMLNSLNSLLAWKASQKGIDALGMGSYGGRAVMNIAGHRDVGNTECPGQMVYNLLPTIRSTVKALATQPIPANQNVVRNGDFGAALDQWQLWGGISQVVQSGVFRFGYINGDPDEATLYQDANYTVQSASPLEAAVDLGSSYNGYLQVTVEIHSGANRQPSDVNRCEFTLPPNAPMRRYTVRTLTNRAWPNLRIHVRSSSPNDGSRPIHVDNISVHYRPDLNPGGLQCIYPSRPANQNLVSNPGFEQDTSGWSVIGDAAYSAVSGASGKALHFRRVGGESGGVYQDLGYSVIADTPFEISLQLGSATSTVRRILVGLGSSLNADGAFACAFTLPANAPLRTYLVRGRAGANWLNTRFQVIITDAEHLATVVMDNVSVQHRPDLTVAAVECATPIQRDTVGVFRPSTGAFYLRNANTTGPANITVVFGISEDLPIAGDWNGDGIDTIGLYRPGTQQFFLKDANTTSAPVAYTFVFGLPGDEPVAGDWDGDGKDSVGVFSNGRFFLRNSLSDGFPDYHIWLGRQGDAPLAGDWDGDGRDSPGVFRRVNALFNLTDQLCNCKAAVHYAFTLGIPNDAGFAGDWNGDGRDGVGVFRPSNGITYLKNALSTGAADIAMIYGIAGDRPLAGRWIAQIAQADASGAPSVQGPLAPAFEPGQ